MHLGAPDDAAERLLPPMLRRFADTHPCVTVNVVVEGSARMVDMVRKGQLDLAMITCDSNIDGVDEIEVLMREQLVWATLAGGGCGGAGSVTGQCLGGKLRLAQGRD